MNIVMASVLLYGFALTACSAAPPASTRAHPPEVSVCALAHAGQRLSGVRIVVTAVSVTDLMHGSMLKDGECPAAFIDVVISANHRDDPDIERFTDAILRDGRKNGLRVFNVSLSGKFTQKGKSGVLVVDRIFSFSKNKTWPKRADE